MRNTFARILLERMDKKECYLLTGDLGFSVFEPIRDAHPTYFINMGVSEQNMVGVASGLAHQGKDVFVYSIVPFIAYRAFEQIRDDVCYPNLKVRFIGVGAGLAYSDAGPTHHSYEDTSVVGSLPNITIFSPSDPKEVEFFMKNLDEVKGPLYMRLSRSGEPVLHQLHGQMKIGKALRIAEGEDILIISTGAITKTAIEVASKLAAEEISSEILEFHTLKPFDSAAVRKEAAGKRLIVTLEENTGYLHSNVAVALGSLEQHAKLLPFTLPDAFLHVSGSRDYLLQKSGLDALTIYSKIKAMIK